MRTTAPVNTTLNMNVQNVIARNEVTKQSLRKRGVVEEGVDVGLVRNAGGRSLALDRIDRLDFETD